ncbi:MAG TPA: DNA gyrase subunit A [Synergistales bacterium]|nr:DNA gyrase subunit A [Synergistales bacterium]
MEEQKGEFLFGKVISLPLLEEIKHSYLDYAMSVIVGRAIPDARDGLKPVQRRILYSMLELGLRHNTAYKKSARVVGETMGKYHPHGDAAIYDTMVRMAQDFSMRYCLVDGQGNFGSIDGDPAAAMRYTEAKLKMIGEYMLSDIDEDTVDWGPNFDESLKEPQYLPSMLPNLLINGSSGIAVGMATNIPPHNISEVADALCYIIDKGVGNAEFGELLELLPGPDFPTGGLILGKEGIIDAYRTGRGKIIMRGRTHVEESKRGKTRVVITEIPYMVNKTSLIEAIAKGVQNKTIDGITDIRDESDRDGLRVVLEISRDADPDLVLRQLYSRTQLQSTFGAINLALVDGEPKELPILDMLNIFLDHRRSVVRRRTTFRLNKAKARAHIVEGLVKALDIIDEVISLIRASRTVGEAKSSLMHQLDFSGLQAQAILDMRLQRLTGLERNKLEEELAQLLSDIEKYQTILENPKVLDSVIREELVDIRKTFGDDRKSTIIAAAAEVSEEELIPESDIVVILSRDGYLRRKPLEDYVLQCRGGKGRRGAALKGEDEIALMAVTSTHKDIYLFTTKGRVLAIKGYVIPETRTGKGKPITRFISLEEEERVVAIRGSSLEEARYVFFLTRKGIAKRLPISELQNLTRAGRRVLTLGEGDEIAEVHKTTGEDELLFISSNGRALKVSEEEFRPMGRTAKGVIGMRLGRDDRIISFDVVDEDKQSLIISENGVGKRTQYSEFTPHHRGASGVKAMNLSARTGKLVCSYGVSPEDEIILISSRGRLIRLASDEIPMLGRTARGSILVRLDEGDSVADLSIVPAEVCEEE